MQRIPLLSDLPIIGELFKNRNVSRKRTELTVFITPRIVPPGTTIPQPVFTGPGTLPGAKPLPK